MTNTPTIDDAATLRQRFIDDMNLHRLSRATQHNYLRDVIRFANWLGRPPDQATDEDLRRYQIEQSETGLGAPAMNAAVSALRFFYCRTLDRPDLTRKLRRVKNARALPTRSFRLKELASSRAGVAPRKASHYRAISPHATFPRSGLVFVGGSG